MRHFKTSLVALALVGLAACSGADTASENNLSGDFNQQDQTLDLTEDGNTRVADEPLVNEALDTSNTVAAESSNGADNALSNSSEAGDSVTNDL